MFAAITKYRYKICEKNKTDLRNNILEKKKLNLLQASESLNNCANPARYLNIPLLAINVQCSHSG